jgi:hypothetical protein
MRTSSLCGRSSSACAAKTVIGRRRNQAVARLSGGLAPRVGELFGRIQMRRELPEGRRRRGANSATLDRTARRQANPPTHCADDCGPSHTGWARHSRRQGESATPARAPSRCRSRCAVVVRSGQAHSSGRVFDRPSRTPTRPSSRATGHGVDAAPGHHRQGRSACRSRAPSRGPRCPGSGRDRRPSP